MQGKWVTAVTPSPDWLQEWCSGSISSTQQKNAKVKGQIAELATQEAPASHNSVYLCVCFPALL